MPDKTVVIRVDGNSKIGLGHVYRGIALAEMLKNEFNIEFIVKSDTTVSPIKNARFEYILLPHLPISSEPAWIKRNYSSDTIIVVDGYSFDENYQQKIKDSGFKLVCINDLPEGTQKADIIINHSPGISKNNYTTESYTKLALGLKYALLRKPFIDIDRGALRPKKSIKKIFISFGGADPNNFSFATAKEVLKLNNIDIINVVLGSAYRGTEIYSFNTSKLKIHRSLSENEMFELMKESDLAVVPASTTSIELASLGIPMMLGYFVKNQENIYQGFVKRNIVIPLGNYNSYNFSELVRKISEIDSLETLSSGLLNCFTENPKYNILNLFRSENLQIRAAISNDVKFIFELSNEPLVRSNSFHSDEIKYQDHVRWYEDQLKDKYILFYILQNNNDPIGQVRIKIQDKKSIIGISISNKYRGRGFASKCLTLATTKYFINHDRPIYAYIKKANLASIKSFKKAGFHFLKNESINRIESCIYKMEKT